MNPTLSIIQITVFFLAWIAIFRIETKADSTEGIRSALEDGKVVIFQNGNSVAEYVFRDTRIPRPYFTKLCAPNGTQVTRNHPPISGVDATDHDLLHPGVWIAFGDLNGVDFWRNKGRVEFVRFLQDPATKANVVAFSVEERFLDSADVEVCRGIESFSFANGSHWGLSADCFVLLWRMRLQNETKSLTFGTQHEMGLGFRITTPVTVKGGNGTIVSSHGGVNEKGNWGKTATWWDYSGKIKDRQSGILAVCAESNSRSVWAHARDYGFIALNPTGAPLKSNAPSEAFTVPAGEWFDMRFGLVFFSYPKTQKHAPAQDAALIQKALKEASF